MKPVGKRVVRKKGNQDDKIMFYGGGVVKGRDFNTVEDSNEAVSIIRSIADYAGKSAAAEAKALDMPKVYAQSKKVIVETADGNKTVVDTAEDLPEKKFFKKYTPGTVMHAIKQ